MAEHCQTLCLCRLKASIFLLCVAKEEALGADTQHGCSTEAQKLQNKDRIVHRAVLKSKKILCRPGAYFHVHDPTRMVKLPLLFIMKDEDLNELGLRKHLTHKRAFKVF